MDGIPLAVFRCDASPALGAGHVMRCLALADTLADAGWRIAFAVGRDTPATAPALTEAGYELTIVPDDDVRVLAEAFGTGADLLAIDHYGRAAAFERTCRTWARHILAFDDATGRDHDCDLLLDAAAADPATYRSRVPEHAHLLLGPAYATLRRGFLARRAEALARRDGRPVRHILVSLGATDPANVTCRVLDALAGVPGDVTVTVVLASSAKYLDVARSRVTGPIRLLTDVRDMASLIAEADLAIGAPGSTAYERAVLGLPTLMVTVADNQRGICSLISGSGAALDAGDADAGFETRLAALIHDLLQDADARVRMAQAASRLIDGRGAQRVQLVLAGTAPTRDGTPVSLRLARPEDEAWLLNLQREPATRRYARNAAVPSAQEHALWLRRTLANPDVMLMIAEADGEPAGMVRLDRHSSPSRHDEVSIAVLQAHQRTGVAAAMLSLCARLRPHAILEAEISPANTASLELFRRAGFTHVSDTTYRRVPCRERVPA